MQNLKPFNKSQTIFHETNIQLHKINTMLCVEASTALTSLENIEKQIKIENLQILNIDLLPDFRELFESFKFKFDIF